MATLTARGHKVIARATLRVQKETETTTEHLEERALRSDGAVLSRLAVRFKPDAFNPEGRWHNYGWKLVRRGEKRSPEEWLRPFRERGWEVMEL